MQEKTIVIAMSEVDRERPVAILVQIASQFDSSVHLVTGDKKINAKSIMGMMSMCFDDGEEMTIVADGPDEAEAVENIAKHLTANA